MGYWGGVVSQLFYGAFGCWTIYLLGLFHAEASHRTGATGVIHERHVLQARPLLTRALEEGIYDTLIDTRLQKEYNPNEMARMVACAAASVRHSARRRPRMSQIVRALEGAASLEDLNEGITPGHNRLYGSSDYDSSSQQYNTNQYNDDMKRMRKLALESQEYGSSEYSGRTSEYGLNPSCSSSEGQQTREMEMSKMKKQSGGFSGNLPPC